METRRAQLESDAKAFMKAENPSAVMDMLEELNKEAEELLHKANNLAWKNGIHSTLDLKEIEHLRKKVQHIEEYQKILLNILSSTKYF